LSLRVISVHAATPDEIVAGFDTMRQEGVQAALFPTDAVFLTQRKQIVDLAAKYRVPAMYSQREFFAAGGLMVYGISVTHMYRRSSTYVHRILKGAKPAELPIEQPDALELAVNLAVAKELGLTIPQPILMRANEVKR
jgi:putative ABC transport system substrate-binding protein